MILDSSLRLLFCFLSSFLYSLFLVSESLSFLVVLLIIRLFCSSTLILVCFHTLIKLNLYLCLFFSISTNSFPTSSLLLLRFTFFVFYYFHFTSSSSSFSLSISSTLYPCLFPLSILVHFPLPSPSSPYASSPPCPLALPLPPHTPRPPPLTIPIRSSSPPHPSSSPPSPYPSTPPPLPLPILIISPLSIPSFLLLPSPPLLPSPYPSLLLFLPPSFPLPFFLLQNTYAAARLVTYFKGQCDLLAPLPFPNLRGEGGGVNLAA